MRPGLGEQRAQQFPLLPDIGPDRLEDGDLAQGGAKQRHRH
jgi:hypothetical protein